MGMIVLMGNYESDRQVLDAALGQTHGIVFRSGIDAPDAGCLSMDHGYRTGIGESLTRDPGRPPENNSVRMVRHADLIVVADRRPLLGMAGGQPVDNLQLARRLGQSWQCPVIEWNKQSDPEAQALAREIAHLTMPIPELAGVGRG